MSTKMRKLGFHEIGKGAFAIDMQEAFEEAQKIAAEKYVDAVVTVKIKVSPPNPREPNFAQIEYTAPKVTHGQPPAKTFSTMLKDGLIVADGDDPADILQIDLDLPTPENPFRRTAAGT